MQCRIGLCLVGFLVILLSGCKEKPPVPAKVSGKVMIGGAPLKKCNLMFHSGKGDIPVIADAPEGTFSVELPPGTYRVEIYHMKLLDPPPPKSEIAPIDPWINILPPRFNTDSTLTLTVSAGEERTVDYPVELK